jgi:recombinational DNA repair protein RecT
MTTLATNPAASFRQLTTSIASKLLVDWVGEERAHEATGRITSSLAASAAAAKNPQDFYDCTPQSVATVVAVSALTGIMPGSGSCALAYAIPRRPRRGEPPQLQYNLSHRGINSLARRSGQTIIATPIGYGDQLHVNESGETIVVARDIDNPPETFEDLRGIAISVKEIATGVVTFSGFVPKSLIEKRRAMSDSWKYDIQKGYQYSPWSNWPIEQAMKTAMHYTAARGWCVIDDTEAVRALSVDTDSDVIKVAEPSRIRDDGPQDDRPKSERVASLLEDEPPASSDTVSEPTEPDPIDPDATPSQVAAFENILNRISNAKHDVDVAKAEVTMSDAVETDTITQPQFLYLRDAAIAKTESFAPAKAT